MYITSRNIFKRRKMLYYCDITLALQENDVSKRTCRGSFTQYIGSSQAIPLDSSLETSNGYLCSSSIPITCCRVWVAQTDFLLPPAFSLCSHVTLSSLSPFCPSLYPGFFLHSSAPICLPLPLSGSSFSSLPANKHPLYQICCMA